jgi:hypothetical protein
MFSAFVEKKALVRLFVFNKFSAFGLLAPGGHEVILQFTGI